jgi:hypothetical protein
LAPNDRGNLHSFELGRKITFMGYSWDIPGHRQAAERVYAKLWSDELYTDLLVGKLTQSAFLRKCGFKSACSVIAALNLLEDHGWIVQEKSPYWMNDPFERILILVP